MPQRILGIDLGSWSLKAVLVEDSMRGLRVEAAREVRVEPGEPDTHDARFAEAVRRLVDGLSFDGVVASMPAEQVTTRFLTLPFQDPKKVAQIIGGELSDLLPFDLDDAVFGYAIEAKLENAESLNLAAAAPKGKVKAVLERLAAHGLDPRFLGVDALDLSNLYGQALQVDQSRPEGAPDAGDTQLVDAAVAALPEARLIVDVGHERTLVVACSPQGVGHVRVIRAGGKQLTQAIAKHYGVDEVEAERIKHTSGLVTSGRHPGSSEAEEELAEVVARGLDPFLRELRRTIVSIRAEKRVRLARIDLVGGGSRVRNLASRLAEELGVPTQHGLAADQLVEQAVPDAARRPAFALAMAACLRAAGDARVCTIDLRQGELAFSGRMEGLKDRLPTMFAAAALLLVLLGVNAAVSYRDIVRREKDLDQEFCKVTKAIIGREICEPKSAMAAMRQPASELGNVKLPERSALNVAADLSELTPTGVNVEVEELDITPDRAKISGESPSFDAVDSLVQEYAKDKCFSEIKKSKLRKKADGDKIEFQLSMNTECS
jgi:Tfp pilus assembly PilM family ATPase